MSKRLREGIEKAKQYYIEKITKFYKYSADELNQLPLNELQDILKKEEQFEKRRYNQP